MKKRILFLLCTCLLLLATLCACGQPEPKKTRAVVFDTDLGTDDAIALLLAQNASDRLFDYIIASQGNTTLDGAVQNAVILKKYLGLHATVVQGMPPAEDKHVDAEENDTFHGSDGLGNLRAELSASLAVTEAERNDFIAFDEFTEVIRAFDEILYIAVGPTTNLANLIGDETIKAKITKVYIMGGGINEFNCSHNTEFNFSKDPQSVKKILASGLDITLFPLDLTNHQYVSADEIGALEAYGTHPAFIAFLRFNMQSNLFYNQTEIAIMHDSMPILYLIDPGLFRTEDRKITVDPYGSTQISEDGHWIHVAVEVADSALQDRLQQAFS